MGLMPVEWSDHGWDTDEWGTSCDRIDSECLYGNTCNRIFTDYSGVVGCYPAQGQRCFNDGAPCGHQLIKNFEMWVRPARTDHTDTHNTCAKLRHPGLVEGLDPGDVPQFSSICDSEGFMKVMQVHTAAYTPTPDAISADAITQCIPQKVVPGVVKCSSIQPDLPLYTSTARARPGRLSALSVSHSKSGVYGGFCMGVQSA
jgi:hypothetical protein